MKLKRLNRFAVALLVSGSAVAFADRPLGSVRRLPTTKPAATKPAPAPAPAPAKAAAPGAVHADTFLPDKLEVGKVGQLHYLSGPFVNGKQPNYKIVSVIDDNSAVVFTTTSTDPNLPVTEYTIILRDDMKGKVDDERVHSDEKLYAVTGTAKTPGGRTAFLLEVYNPKK